MLRDALDAYVRRDTALAQRVLDADDELDALKTQVFRELLDFMLKDPATIEPALAKIKDALNGTIYQERVAATAARLESDYPDAPRRPIQFPIFQEAACE